MILQIVINQTRFHVMSHAGQSMQYRWKAETLCAGGAHWQQAFRRFGQHNSCFWRGRDVAWSKTVSLIFLCFFWTRNIRKFKWLAISWMTQGMTKLLRYFHQKGSKNLRCFFWDVKKVVHLAALQASSKYYKAWKVSEIVNRAEGNCNVASDSRKEKFDRGLRRGSDSP